MLHRTKRELPVGLLILLLALGGAGTPVARAQESGSEPSGAEVEAIDGDEAPDAAGDETAGEEDGKAKKKGGAIVPIPIFLTEPAIGVGLGVALSYFWKPKGEAAAGEGDPEDDVSPVLTQSSAAATGRQRKPPPTVSAVAGAYTDEGTWFTGIGHFDSWRRDSIRYSGILAYAHIESKLYRLGLELGFTLEGYLTLQDVKLRVGRSPFLLGLKVAALDAQSRFRTSIGDQSFDIDTGDLRDVGLAIQGIWDTQDNTLMPVRGRMIELDAWRYDEAFGGDYDYWKLKLKAHSFHPLGPDWVLGWRLEGEAAYDTPPFWGFPWVSMRGIPALRYQNDRVGVAEVEARWRLFERWTVLGFAGVGATTGSSPQFDDENQLWAGGAGARWLFKPEQDIWVGVDIARGPESTYWYIKIGQAW